MLTLEGLCIQQDDFTLSADLSIAAGARVAVVGPSGAGKSTFLGAMAGFVPLTKGRITWKGQDLTDAAPAVRPIAMLFQDHNLFPHLTAAQNIGLGLRPDLRLSTAQRGAVDRALEQVGLQGLGPRKPSQLSGGQQSRVAIARVLLQNRPVILLDEPFAALGPALKVEMLDLVAQMAAQQAATLLMVSHDPDDAARLCPQTVLVAEGRAFAPQDTSVLLADPPPALRAYLG
ncbi:thiamine ABC transporter ATP-binding protein [Litorivita pollutaquae]|uniref:Thiamine ABC transporter ATP-binding protein n=1 Tax=Litorivita pollutaquae TaxID=2200892 RepID=A0A2V4MPP6_9RHOB|nr:ATP-binding cassette domain-containing protein [Litorivita pollutaquae]PYC47509.1 thiamine ABC transporter ATP-binding protein [Litorivita pollutaquae]